MSTCPQYRKIADSHFALFCRLNAREFECENRPLGAADREELRLAMRELDDHMSDCSVCRRMGPRCSEDLGRITAA
jgi:hypothetical protein